MNCDCNCDAKCHMLGGLEQKIMDVLWSSSVPLKPSEIIDKMTSRPAYTTVTTVLKRMLLKHLVHRHSQGKVFLYTPVRTKPEFAHECLDDLFSRLFDSYGLEVVASFNRVLQHQPSNISLNSK